MRNERPRRDDGDPRFDLRLAAMVAEHEQRKWNVVRHVAQVLARLDVPPRSEGRDRPADSGNRT